MTAWDEALAGIADYAVGGEQGSPEARDTARLALMDALGCALLALEHPECERLLGPWVPDAHCVPGSRVPGTGHVLDPVKAAFDIGAMIRWLDFNDTWLAAEWGHPSDNLGAILAVADYESQTGRRHRPITVGEVLTAMVKAYEIQGVLALENAFNRVGLDHVLLVRVASTAVAAVLLGCGREQVLNATSNAFLDGGALRTYRHAPNVGSRKSWAAGDATSRGVRLALMARSGEMGYATALSAEPWGFCQVLMGGRTLTIPRALASYVMEHLLFKVRYPAEFHGQTAVEAALRLHAQVAPRLDQVEEVRIDTQEPAVRIIDKTGLLLNPADRDHCLQYMVAVALIHGRLNHEDYLEAVAADPRIDWLRSRMHVREESAYTRDYLDPEKRAIPNALQVVFEDGSATERVEVVYPLGHRRRREEARPLLLEKARANLSCRLPGTVVEELLALFQEPERLEGLPVPDFLQRFLPPGRAAEDVTVT